MPQGALNPNLSVTTFTARLHPAEQCGSNGLPLTPNSIAILGRSQILKSIDHPSLCEYIDIIRGKHERIIIVAESRGNVLSQYPLQTFPFSNDWIKTIFIQLVDGLSHLDTMNMRHYNISPDNIYVYDDNKVKLFNYGIHHMTMGGKLVNFPLGCPRFLSPEQIFGSCDNIKTDMWAIGMLIAELAFQRKLWENLNLAQIFRKILSLSNVKNIFEKIAKELNTMDVYNHLDNELKDMIEMCLIFNVNDRATPQQFLNKYPLKVANNSPTNCEDIYSNENLLFMRPLKEIYYWWKLTGGDVQAELKKEGLIKSEAPILTMPRFVYSNGKSITVSKSQSCLMDNQVIKLNLSILLNRLSKIEKRSYFPPIITENIFPPVKDKESMKQLPLIIRETDTEYQFRRVILFKRLLENYPYTRNLIVKEAEIDIPPIVRGEVWACLLNILPMGIYDKIDKMTPTPTDRQIEVDIPRCHQYDELLSSPEGHRKLKRLLKSWVTAHPQYVYWQGLDSLTAPFLYLNFNDEERAFLCLYNFIPKYLHWFFLKDNSLIIKEYLNKFSQLTAYHEPILAKHLKEISFIPELFAIPWFLTMFSHVFPLQKIIHLWDKLILGDSSYPLFIGVSILNQLKGILLESGFNECILLFSDLPDIVMETSVQLSQKMYESTPSSITHRKYVLQTKPRSEFDAQDLELDVLQSEISPRISLNDLVKYMKDYPNNITIIDLRNEAEFKRAHLEGSRNVPFSSLPLTEMQLEVLNIPNVEEILKKSILVVVISCNQDNAILFSKILIDFGIAKVCTLQGGFNILHSYVPNLLTSST